MMGKVGLLSKNPKLEKSLTNNKKKHGVTSAKQTNQLSKTNGGLSAKMKSSNLNHHVTLTLKKNQATRKLKSRNLRALMVLTL